MTSDPKRDQIYVWTRLARTTEPVVAGLLRRNDQQMLFAYGRSDLARENAISPFELELPLRAGPLPLLNGLSIPNSIRDTAADAWERRVILNRRFGARGREIDAGYLDELTFLMETGSDRVGALDFQASPTVYVSRDGAGDTLEQLLDAVALVEQGIPLTPDLDRALFHRTSFGGARPKATITCECIKYVAKFSSANDIYSVVKAEFIAMRLASKVGLDVAPVSLQRVAGKDALLLELRPCARRKRNWVAA